MCSVAYGSVVCQLPDLQCFFVRLQWGCHRNNIERSEARHRLPSQVKHAAFSVID